MCDAKIRPFRGPGTDDPDLEVQCGLPLLHEGFHVGVIKDYAYPGSETSLQWADDDRRTFRGTFTACPDRECSLPYGHRGRHVY